MSYGFSDDIPLPVSKRFNTVISIMVTKGVLEPVDAKAFSKGVAQIRLTEKFLEHMIDYAPAEEPPEDEKAQMLAVAVMSVKAIADRIDPDSEYFSDILDILRIWRQDARNAGAFPLKG